MIGDDTYNCKKMEGIRYDLIVGGDSYRICDFADEMCKCLDKARVNPGQYNVINNKCYSFVGWAISCACEDFRYDSGLLGDYCRDMTGFRAEQR